MLGEPSNSYYGFIAHCRDGVIFHSHVLCNDGCHGIHDDDDWTCKSVGMDSLALLLLKQREESNQKLLRKMKIKKKTKFKKMYNINKLRWVHTK